MENEEEPIEELSKEELDKAFKAAIESAERLHNSLTSATEGVGYTRQVLISSHARYLILYDEAQNNPSLYSVVASGLQFVKNVGSELNRLSGLAGDIEDPLSIMSYSTGSFSGSTDAAIGLSGIQDMPGLESVPAPLPRKSREDYSSRLKALDTSLSKTYDQVWQTYYGTSADRHRASLFMMRQVYDHFFSCLAPDELVRKSEYWTRKEGDKPDRVYRSERMVYAAHTHIKILGLADTLAASAKQINNLYEAANEVHNRGNLNEENADKTLLAMDSILKDWIDALH